MTNDCYEHLQTHTHTRGYLLVTGFKAGVCPILERRTLGTGTLLRSSSAGQTSIPSGATAFMHHSP